VAKKSEWAEFKQSRYGCPVLFDPVWGREVLTQPFAIHLAWQLAQKVGAISFFDAGDVQANGFQIVEDHHEVDYVQWAASIKGLNALFGGYSGHSLADVLEKAYAFKGLSLIHVPVYFGDNTLGGLGAFGCWNVGNWVADTQRLRHEIGL
jgi:hypothetical protein